MNREELLKEMERVLETGGEQALEKFTLEHFNELPEDVQGKVLFGFFSQTLDKQTAEAATAEIQTQGLEALEKIEEIKTSIKG